MPKAKLELSKSDAAKVNAAHALAGTSTDEAFQVGDVFHVTVRSRSAEGLVKFGRAMGSLTDADLKQHEERMKAKAEKAKAKK